MASLGGFNVALRGVKVASKGLPGGFNGISLGRGVKIFDAVWLSAVSLLNCILSDDSNAKYVGLALICGRSAFHRLLDILRSPLVY